MNKMKPILGMLTISSVKRAGAYSRSVFPAMSFAQSSPSLYMSSEKHENRLLSAPSAVDAVGFFNDLDFLLPPFRAAFPSTMHMALDMKDKKDHYDLIMDVPGCEKKDIHLHINKERLTVSADRHIKIENDERHIRRERQNHFSRTITIPDTVDKERIDAHYECGVLTIMLPKNPVAHKEHSKTIKLK